MPDQALVERDRRDLALGAAGERGAFDRLFTRHEAALQRLAWVLTHDEAMAEDVVQEGLLAAVRHAADFRGEGSVRAWLMSITRRAALHERRRRVGEPEEWATLDEETLGALGAAAGWGSPPTPEALLSAEERRRALVSLLERLSPTDREVIHLRDLEGLSYEEVAGALEESLSAVKTRLHRARLRLMALARAAQGDADV